MLVLTRTSDKPRILIDNGRIAVEILRVDRRTGSVRLGITAPPGVSVDREEIHQRKEKAKNGKSEPL